MTHDDVIDKIWYQIRNPGAVISLYAQFKHDMRYIKIMSLNDPKMTHDDVTSEI